MDMTYWCDNCGKDLDFSGGRVHIENEKVVCEECKEED